MDTCDGNVKILLAFSHHNLRNEITIIIVKL